MTMRSLFDPAPLPSPDPATGRRVMTVSELNATARAALERALPSVWVEGEVSNVRRAPSGHVYFTLKDATAQVGAVLFRTQAAGLRFRLEDGLKVLAFGRVSLYEARGSYQVILDLVEPAGLGALQLAFEQLKARLQAEGLFDQARKRALPVLPRRIGIVASPSGAALRDILMVLERRFAGLHVVVAPSRVQGDGAAAEIVDAIRRLNTLGGLDLIILARGGGSIEDLWSFNEEIVARAIAASAVPVVSAVGHEIDVTIADLVADLRAPTPSAAAEMIVRSRREFLERLAALRARLRSAAALSLSRRRHDLAGRGIGRALEVLRARWREAALRVDERASRLRVLADLRLERLRAATAGAGARLEALSPLAVLARGYAICRDAATDAILKEAARVAPGSAVRVRLHRGGLLCAVTEVDDGGR